MNTPIHITFTGVDAHTDFGGMARLSAMYPIEWGILFSGKRQGQENRYPPLSAIHDLVIEYRMAFSAHLCGSDARAVIEAGRSPHDELIGSAFIRAQINTADPHVQPSLIGHWAHGRGVRAILQCRGAFPAVKAVDVLFDASGGRGISPADWPEAHPESFCGYAGGLGPDNVAAAVSIIKTRARHYWIDMESGVRDENDLFSLDKCRAVCEAVYGVRP